MSRELVTVADGTDARDVFDLLSTSRARLPRRSSTPTAAWSACITRKGALRSTIYRPAVDADGRLMIAVAVGINGDPDDEGQGAASTMGVDVLVIDTAHGHQTRTLHADRGGRGRVAATRRSWPATSSPPTARAS